MAGEVRKGGDRKKPGGKVHIVRHRSVNEWEHDPNLDLPTTPEEVEDAERSEIERLLEQPPLGVDPPGMMRGKRR